MKFEEAMVLKVVIRKAWKGVHEGIYFDNDKKYLVVDWIGGNKSSWTPLQ